MDKNLELKDGKCLNCDASIEGSYCSNCGQAVRDNSDRSLSGLLGDFFGNIFFIDNRFLFGVYYLFRYPSRMTVEFLEGKRKKFIPPVTLFLFFNLIYFFGSILSDYSLALYDQVNSQLYSGWTREWVLQEIKEKGIDLKAYNGIYQNASDQVSKTIMIINVPMIALIVYLMSFKRRKFYFDSLIFAFHFFSLFMFSLVMLSWIGPQIDNLTGDENSMLALFVSQLFFMIVPLVYAVLGMRKFLGVRWYWAIPAGMGVLGGIVLSNIIYRFIILIVTVWVT